MLLEATHDLDVLLTARERAEAEDRSVSAVVRVALREYIEYGRR